MKKFVIALCVFALCCTLCVSAFAAPKQGGVTVGENHINVTVIEDFTGTSEKDNYSHEDYWHYVFNGKTMNIKITGNGSGLWHNSANEGPALPADDDTKAAWASAKYFGYQIKNGSKEDITVAPESTVIIATSGEVKDWGALMQNHNSEEEMAQWPVVLVSADGKMSNASEKAAGNYRNWGVVIPAGFTGWVFFPFARTNELGNGNYLSNTVFYMEYQVGSAFDFTINRVALADTMELAQGAGDLDGFESKDTADFSVIAYAVAAITGCGALVVAKKRG